MCGHIGLTSLLLIRLKKNGKTRRGQILQVTQTAMFRNTVLCLRLQNVDWSCRPKHQQVHCCLSPRCSEQIGVPYCMRALALTWAALQSGFQNELLRCNTLRLKQRGAVPQSMHSEPLASTSATARMFTELLSSCFK